LPGESDWTPRERAAVGRFNPSRSLVRRVASPAVAAVCRLLVGVANPLTIHGDRQLLALRDRALREQRGLLTFSNHVSLFDDPWLMASLCEPWWDELRWIPVDALNFYDTPGMAWFFGIGKGVPIIRGGGIDQPAMHFMAERLKAGEWVHIFPEGTRSRSPRQLHRPLKPGLAHLVRAGRPLMMPFHHRGMEKVLPIGAKLPRVGQRVEVWFGEVEDSDKGLADRSVAEITDWAEARLLALQDEADGAG
jgi:monolysocardiolipin acyltransferase